MRVLKHAIIGLLIFTLVFLFLPTGQDGNAVVDNFQATTSYATSFKTTASQLVSPYVAQPVLSGANNEYVAGMGTLTSTATGWTGYLYEMCDVNNPSVSLGFETPAAFSSRFGNDKHATAGVHGGTDMVPSSADNIVWTVALLPGTVVKADWNKSYGWHVRQSVDGVPGLYILYAHLGEGWGGREGSDPHHEGAPPAWQSQDRGQMEWNTNGYKGKSSLVVSVGDHVGTGQRLGYYGHTGSSTNPHSHVELRFYLNSDGTPNDFGGNAPTTDNCYRADVWSVLKEGKSFSELEWVWYYYAKNSAGKSVGHVNFNKTMTRSDIEIAMKDTTEGGVD